MPNPTGRDSRGHNHQRCVADAMATAVALCAARGARLTAMRRRVLELIWASHVPVGAYDLIDRLRDNGLRVAPPTVYRALAFLAAEGLIHRIESKNAFIGCDHASEPHQAQYLICERCGNATEVEGRDLGRRIEILARDVGFRVRRQSVEIHGTCRDCAGQPHHA